MDNVLLQVSGHKKVVLFPPSDVNNIYMKGDKSQVLDIDNPDLEKYPLFANVTRYECELVKGDALFIPGI
jgi:tRNA wybutosine-synthesizing protein 5